MRIFQNLCDIPAVSFPPPLMPVVWQTSSFLSHSLVAACIKKTNINCAYFKILKDKTMVDKLMDIPNDGTQKYPFFALQLLVKTFGHSTY